MNIQAVEFTRVQNGSFEKGIMINNDQLIIDKDGNIVKPPVWIILHPQDLCINIFDKYI